MIFTKKNYKIMSGTNPSLYMASDSEIVYYVFNSEVRKVLLSLSSTMKSTISSTTYPYNHVKKLNSSHLCVCFDDNISVIDEES